MFAVGLDVDKRYAFVFTKNYLSLTLLLSEKYKILLYAGNSYPNLSLELVFLCCPLVFYTLGKINKCEKFNAKKTKKGQSAGNFQGLKFTRLCLKPKTKLLSTIPTLCNYIRLEVGVYNNCQAVKPRVRTNYIFSRFFSSYKHLPKISEHVPLRKRYLSDNDFGYFLAGLIDGAGEFNKYGLHLKLKVEDVALAYYIKKRIGYGTVVKLSILPHGSLMYICKKELGIYYILNLINGKLSSEIIINSLINLNYCNLYSLTLKPIYNNITYTNYWLSGFTQVNGYFNIKIKTVDQKDPFPLLCKHEQRTPSGLLQTSSLVLPGSQAQGVAMRDPVTTLQMKGGKYKPEQKVYYNSDLVVLEFGLKNIKNVTFLGEKLINHKILALGKLKLINSQVNCYISSHYVTAAFLINYFDSYNLFGLNYIKFLKFRKCYIMITKGLHLEKKGITRIKSIASKGSSETSTQDNC